MEAADAIAKGMKDWAVENGATHYSHWFQPLNGGTAEKHECFMKPIGKSGVIMDFSGKELVRGEPDASSFPSGGLRETFEARGYSAWDPSSSVFIEGSTLYIPSVFFSYSGESLDNKTPLLRSERALSRQAIRLLKLMGDKESKSVTAMAGAEQEYFLMDKELFSKREDLLICGRTLFGSRPPKTQQMSDHYFGSIKPRAAAFMRDLEIELWKLGVYAKTKHNEVAPSQFEMAPIFTECNRATDQNQLTMNLMRKVADRHGLVCILHEKPFEGVNGSGKHNNWSLMTDKGLNLFSPGKTPFHNTCFLLFLTAFISGVDEYQDLLRSTVAYAANDSRLGGNEAPPAIISIYVGFELESIIETIVKGEDYDDKKPKRLKMGIGIIPPIPMDTTDRNRTSPIAFTGNKFEFRMPGSGQSIASPNTILNAIMAEKLCEYSEIIAKSEEKDRDGVVHKLIRDELKNHSGILFSGNCYDASWVKEAKKRGLLNLSTSVEAITRMHLKKNISLLEKHGIMSETEVVAREEVYLENYSNIRCIEANTMIGMAEREIIPAISSFENLLCDVIIKKSGTLGDESAEIERSRCRELSDLNAEKSSMLCRDSVVPEMERIRGLINSAEKTVPSGYWPYPVYSSLLFSV